MRISDWSSDVCSSDLPEVLGEQPVEQARDCGAVFGVGRLQRQVALAVGAHGAVVEVGRADAQQAVVDDHHIGVDHDALARRVARHRREHQLHALADRSEEHTSELQSLMRISYAVFCLKKKKTYERTTPRPTKQ